MIDIQNMTVLIVDDAPSTCQLLHKLLKNMGYGHHFLYANSGREALEILQKERVDLVLLDYHMPGMTGVEVLGEIRDEKALRDLPVIMVTAEATSDFVAGVGESEIDGYLLKPINITTLEEKVSYVVEKANNPPPMIYHLKRAREFEESGDLEKAIEETKLAIKAEPKVTKPIRKIGYYYYKMNRFVEAEKWLLKAVSLNQVDVTAFHHLAELYLKRNDIEKASLFFEKAMKISPRHLERGINFAKTLVHLKMITKAVEVFDKALELDGATHEMQEEVADFCIEEEINDYAAQLLESLVREDPDRADLHFKLGKSFEKLGDTKKAITFLVNAEALDYENEDIKIHLAKGYLALDKPMMAEVPLNKLLDNNPDNELARKLLRQCT